MTKVLSHVHTRSYFGEFTAAPLVDWLNNKARPKRDPVEELVRLNASLALPLQTTEHDVESYLSRIVRKTKLAVAPVLLTASPKRWEVDWRLVGRMNPSQGLALVKLLHLADQGLLGRIRQCPKKECGRWFYARFEHQRFDSKKCQVETFTSDPEWKQQRAEYMKRQRAESKLRDLRNLSRAKGKKK